MDKEHLDVLLSPDERRIAGTSLPDWARCARKRIRRKFVPYPWLLNPWLLASLQSSDRRAHLFGARTAERGAALELQYLPGERYMNCAAKAVHRIGYLQPRPIAALTRRPREDHSTTGRTLWSFRSAGGPQASPVPWSRLSPAACPALESAESFWQECARCSRRSQATGRGARARRWITPVSHR
jgi:hypothetical protein